MCVWARQRRTDGYNGAWKCLVWLGRRNKYVFAKINNRQPQVQAKTSIEIKAVCQWRVFVIIQRPSQVLWTHLEVDRERVSVMLKRDRVRNRYGILKKAIIHSVARVARIATRLQSLTTDTSGCNREYWLYKLDDPDSRYVRLSRWKQFRNPRRLDCDGLAA